jgi:hypothetical protein
MVNKYNPKYKREGRSKEKFERLKQEMHDRFEKECTFQPKIIYDFEPRLDESRENLFNRLSAPKMRLVKDKEEEKVEECTFKPKINENRSKSREEVSSRLYKLAADMKEKREKLMKENEKKKMDECKFKPIINPTSKELAVINRKKPLYSNVNIINLV